MEQVIKEILKGKKGAATVFYREYSPKLRRFLVAKLPSEADAEELLQDIFLSVFDSLPIYRGECSVMSWIYSIARHEVADFYRKRYVRELVEKTNPLFEELMETVETPEKVLDKTKKRAQFFAVYKGLNQSYQDILSYRYELSLSVKEIAAKMKLTFKATESLLYRARTAFALAYETYAE
ncbi:sigma-70 family RNA polymerase sigma factor [Candidatus Woesebacteria bacterium]|nr:sigma-70 family RNA polymerase sigma factor [Candidatus Woesebacteria bacterium]